MRPIVLKTVFFFFLFFPLIVSAQMDTVYIDKLGTNWYDESWGGNNNNVASTTNPYSGTKCIEIEYTEWGYYGFNHMNGWAELYYYPNQYKYLNFYFNPGNKIWANLH